MSEGDLIAYYAQEKKRGDEITFTVIRDGKREQVKTAVSY